MRFYLRFVSLRSVISHVKRFPSMGGSALPLENDNFIFYWD